MSGEVGRAMLSSVPVSFAGYKSCSSLRRLQSMSVQRETAQHVLYKLREIMLSLALVAV